MKKLLTLIAVIGAMAAPAKAQEQKTQPFLGLEVSRSNIGMNYLANAVVADNYYSASIQAGVKMQKKIPVAVSLFYQKAKEEKAATTGLKTDFKAAGLDSTYYFPVGDALSLTANLGLGYYSFNCSDLGYSEDKIGVRMGAGLEYSLSDNFAVQSTFRYTDLNFGSDGDVAKDMTEVSVGVKFYF